MGWERRRKFPGRGVEGDDDDATIKILFLKKKTYRVVKDVLLRGEVVVTRMRGSKGVVYLQEGGNHPREAVALQQQKKKKKKKKKKRKRKERKRNQVSPTSKERGHSEGRKSKRPEGVVHVQQFQLCKVCNFHKLELL